ncbi:MAG TPA: prepilin peptidase, partial [Armatimonadota bacterium]
MPLTLTYIAGMLMSALFGLVIGSFLNVCIYRLPLGGSLMHPPSHCPSCQTQLRPLDLVPLLSFLALRGKCRYCGTRISWRYFTIELITGMLFAAIWWSLAAQYGSVIWSPAGLFMLALLCVWAAAMLVTFMIDLDTTYVIEPVTWVAMAAGVIFELTRVWLNWDHLGFTIGGLAIPYLPAAVPGMIIGYHAFVGMDLFGRLIFRKQGMGDGDAYIGAAIGAMLGPALALLSFGMAVFLGAIIGILFFSYLFFAERKRAKMEQQAKKHSKKKHEEVAAMDTVDEGEDALPPSSYLPYGPLFTLLMVALALAPRYLAGSGAAFPTPSPFSLGIALLLAAAVGYLLIAMGSRARTVPDTEVDIEEEELPAGHYMPFGPFLTASAVIVALAPEWFGTSVQHLFQWWLRT